MSGGMLFGNLILIAEAVGLNHKLLGLSRSLAIAFGYISKVTSAMLSDRVNNRKYFLLVGYGLSLILKPLFILSVYPGFSKVFKISLFFILNIFDRFISSIRDIPRDSMISEIDPNNVKNNILMRKMSSYLGTTTGIVIGNILYSFNYSPFFVASVAYIPCFLGVITVFSNIPETFSENDKKLSFQEFITSVKAVFMDFIPLIVGLCIGLLGKINEAYFWSFASKYLAIKKSSSWLSFLSYLTSAMVSFILTRVNINRPKYWLILSFFSLLLCNLLGFFYLNKISIIICTFLMGIFSSFLDTLIPIIVLDNIKQKQIKGTMVSCVNIFLSTIFFISPILCNYLLDLTTLHNICGIATFPCVISIILFYLFL